MVGLCSPGWSDEEVAWARFPQWFVLPYPPLAQGTKGEPLFPLRVIAASMRLTLRMPFSQGMGLG
jgi:hypothetical protein